ETDTEVVAHLIEKFYRRSLKEAVEKSVRRLQGSFALAAFSIKEPKTLVAARRGSPLIVGEGEKGKFLASDLPALVPAQGSLAEKVVYLQEDEIAVITGDSLRIESCMGKRKSFKRERVNLKSQEVGKQNKEHFMIKEIFEQPRVMKDILAVYAPGNKLKNPASLLRWSKHSLKDLKYAKKVHIVACGTAYHAGFVGKYFLEKHCRLDAAIDTSSEFRYRKMNIRKGDLVIAISQSGETADTLAAVREAKKKGALILSICNNVQNSSLMRESDFCTNTLAGPEIGVASTKAYTAQVLCFYLIALYLAMQKNILSAKEIGGMIKSFSRLNEHQKAVLSQAPKIKRIARAFSKFGSFLFLGRGINYPSALEGALKLKEISYIPAEGYAAGEMKHGPIALIDEYRGIVCIAPRDELYEKMISNMQEVKARKGKIVAILSQGDKEASSLSDKIISIPVTKNQDLTPLLVAVCLQLFAYYVAKNRGCEIDQPRNLAKSVTVE
ncbi:MAG: glutamine--fructose-6-phosphate transaminase (isomerizing), partial [Candidatus Omnitrophica bacterium]|nr:glutamine--fructose-6-phosphate transaminase (isomerizing) [Candidatus Omnitrophota bacterium]